MVNRERITKNKEPKTRYRQSQKKEVELLFEESLYPVWDKKRTQENLRSYTTRISSMTF